MQNPVQTEQITIVNIIPTGTGFGVTSDGTSVFVPPRVISAADAEIGDIFSASLVNNDFNPSGRTPLLAVRLDRAEPTHDAHEVSHRDRIIEMLREGYATSAEIGEALGMDAIGAKNILKGMWEKGEIAKALIYARADQKRATHVLWALHADDFLGEEIDG